MQRQTTSMTLVPPRGDGKDAVDISIAVSTLRDASNSTVCLLALASDATTFCGSARKLGLPTVAVVLQTAPDTLVVTVVLLSVVATVVDSMATPRGTVVVAHVTAERVVVNRLCPSAE